MSDYMDKAVKSLGEPRERCAVSDVCDGRCRDRHLNQEGMKCPAWYTDEMDKRKRRKIGR